LYPNQYAEIFAYVLITLFVVLGVWSTIAWRKKEASRRASEKSQNVRRAAFAREMGWQYRFTSEADIKFHFNGVSAQGVAWEIYFDLDASSTTSAAKLVFTAKSLRAEHINLLIGDAYNFDTLKQGAGAKALGLAKLLLDRLSNGKIGEMVTFYDSAQTRRFGNWIVATRAPVQTNAIGWQRVIDQLNRWPASTRHPPQQQPCSKTIEATQNRDGLKIVIRIDEPETQFVQHLAMIGVHICGVLSLRA
jgi:hypothetical protein